MAIICYDTLLLHCKILSLLARGTKEGPVKIAEQANAPKEIWVKRGYKECRLQNMLMLSAWVAHDSVWAYQTLCSQVSISSLSKVTFVRVSLRLCNDDLICGNSGFGFCVI